MPFKHTIRIVDGILVVDGHGDTVDLWAALRAHFLKHRTCSEASDGTPYPETTVLEVLEVCTIFDRALSRAPRHTPGRLFEARAWERATRRAEAIAAGRGFDDIYPENERFWLRDTPTLAVFLMFAPDLLGERRAS